MDKLEGLKEYVKTEKTLSPIKAIKFDKNNWDKMVEVTDGAVSKLTIVKVPYERACCMLNTGKSEILVEEGNYIVEDFSLVDRWVVISQKEFEGMPFLKEVAIQVKDKQIEPNSDQVGLKLPIVKSVFSKVKNMFRLTK